MNVDQLNFEVPEDIRKLIPEPRLASIVETFTQLDSNQDGKIELDEYLDFALAKEKARLTKTFKAVDTDKDGSVDFKEFVAATKPNFRILKKFRELDLDRNGLLSLEEALRIAEQLSLPLSSESVRSIMNDVAGNGEGQITYYEYLGAIAHIGFQ
jgi:calmodulin